VRLVRAGELALPVEAEYTLDDARAALAHAARERRRGKILLLGE